MPYARSPPLYKIPNELPDASDIKSVQIVMENVSYDHVNYRLHLEESWLDIPLDRNDQTQTNGYWRKEVLINCILKLPKINKILFQICKSVHFLGFEKNARPVLCAIAELCKKSQVWDLQVKLNDCDLWTFATVGEYLGDHVSNLEGEVKRLITGDGFTPNDVHDALKTYTNLTSSKTVKYLSPIELLTFSTNDSIESKDKSKDDKMLYTYKCGNLSIE